ncbi:trichohyalin-like [Centruroides sculpturatus]|uniref:trichohyalin-like n=1 Tax=Centruroides sculpturatus TaxID=218467 RepID=UPI000C6DA5E9|nr:trichohyalin-like [Centruroides sculpturatus]
METVEIRSMTDARNGENSEVQEGRVEQVCREWLIREDGVLAYKLQTEEIEQHYNYNRHRNRLVRTDMQEAKTVQQIEDEEADLQQKYEQMLLEQQERDDELIAQKLQEQLTKEDIEKQKHVEQEDERLARQLQEKEKHRLERKRLEWELRQVEKARCQQSPTNINRENECSTRNEVETVSKSFAKTQITPPVDLLAKEDKDSDLSDFCLKPPPGLTDDEMKKFQEEQDAELARLLQEQETKRRGPNFKDRQLAIEAQDRELARVLQEQERAKAKKAREKARQKAMLQQQQQQQEMETIEEVSSTSPDSKDGLDHPNLDHRLHQEMDRRYYENYLYLNVHNIMIVFRIIRLARQLQEKEKHRLERKRLEWELRQVEKARCQQSPTNINRENECSTRNEVETVSKSFAKTQITPPVDLLAKEDKDSDLSDFCLKPPPGLTDDEMKKFQEEQDAELARLLQEQETKRRGPNFKDRQLAIEAQDRELARVLQEQERAKAKKAREKARQKAMLQQQQQQQEMETIEEVSSTSPDSKDGLDHPNLDHRLHQEMDRSFIDDDDEASTSGLPNKAVHNIAMVIDPTYNRQKAQSLGSPQNSLCNTPTSSPNRAVPQCPGDSLINCGVNNGYFECGEEEECEGAVPPYMPIQGQRRTSSLDKAKKKKKEKDGCKTQ